MYHNALLLECKSSSFVRRYYCIAFKLVAVTVKIWVLQKVVVRIEAVLCIEKLHLKIKRQNWFGTFIICKLNILTTFYKGHIYSSLFKTIKLCALPILLERFFFMSALNLAYFMPTLTDKYIYSVSKTAWDWWQCVVKPINLSYIFLLTRDSKIGIAFYRKCWTLYL